MSTAAFSTITTGGTLSMGTRDVAAEIAALRKAGATGANIEHYRRTLQTRGIDGLLEPAYDNSHFALAMLLVENEDRIGTQEVDRCLRILTQTKAPIFTLTSSPSASVRKGIARQIDDSLNEVSGVINTALGTSLSLDALIERAGFGRGESNIAPYLIDSIVYQADRHREPLGNALKSVLDKGQNAMIFGGTDTEISYAPIAVEDVAQLKDPRGQHYFSGSNGQKAVFVSAMSGFEKNPRHIVKLIKAGRRVLAQPELTGGFALSAADETADRVTVHDVRCDFEKISSQLYDAFRSNAPAGWIENGAWKANPKYQARPFATPSSAPKRLRDMRVGHVAMPLMSDNSTKEIKAYLEAVRATNAAFFDPHHRYLRNLVQSKEPLQRQFDAVIIEGMPSVTGDQEYDFDLSKIGRIIKEMKSEGIQVILLNPLRHNATTDALEPMVDEEQWQQSLRDGALGDLQGSGAIVWDHMLPKDAYIRATREFTDISKHPPNGGIPAKRPPKGSIFSLRYMPFSNAVHDSLVMLRDRVFADESYQGLGMGTIIIYGLPGSEVDIDRRVLEHLSFDRSTLEDLAMQGVDMLRGFEYAGEDRGDFVEGESTQSAYAAGSGSGMTPVGPRSAAVVRESLVTRRRSEEAVR